MGFLASRRDQSKELSNNNPTKGRKEKGGAAGAEDEISRFFSAGKQVLSERDMNRQDKRLEGAVYPYDKAHDQAKGAVSRRSDQRESPYPPIELPAKPFLGFGNRGAQPLSSIQSHGRVMEATLSAARSDVTQHTLSRSTTSYTWSRSGIASIPTTPKRHGDLVQSPGFPVVSTASNPAGTSMDVGQLCQRSNPELRLLDTQTILSHGGPRPYSSSAESTRQLHRKTTAQPPHSQPAVDSRRPTEAGKACHNTGELLEPARKKQGLPEQQPADVSIAHTTNIGRDVHVTPADAEELPAQLNEPENQVQYLEFLLDACKTTLAGLRKIGYDPPILRATEPPVRPGSVGLDEALSLLNAGGRERTPLSPGLAKAEHEGQKTLPGELRESITQSPKQSAAKPSNLVGLSGDASLKNLEDVSGVELIEHRTGQPMSSTCGVPAQQQAPYNAATDFDRRNNGYENHELQDTRTPLARSRVSNPHQSRRFAYVNADSQQGSANIYALQHAREGHSTDWLGSSRYTPLTLGASNLLDWNHDVGDSQLRTAYGTSYAPPSRPRDLEIVAPTIQDNSILADIEAQSGYDRDSSRYEGLIPSTTNHSTGSTLWLDEFTDEDSQTYMREDALDDETMYSQEAGIERDVNHLASTSDTDERPMTRFWHPHRLY